MSKKTSYRAEVDDPRRGATFQGRGDDTLRHGDGKVKLTQGRGSEQNPDPYPAARHQSIKMEELSFQKASKKKGRKKQGRVPLSDITEKKSATYPSTAMRRWKRRWKNWKREAHRIHW